MNKETLRDLQQSAENLKDDPGFVNIRCADFCGLVALATGKAKLDEPAEVGPTAPKTPDPAKPGKPQQ